MIMAPLLVALVLGVGGFTYWSHKRRKQNQVENGSICLNASEDKDDTGNHTLMITTKTRKPTVMQLYPLDVKADDIGIECHLNELAMEEC